MTDSTKNLPNNYHQGYCYFDVNTGKFWIDTTDNATGRMAINAHLADIATLAKAAEKATYTNPVTGQEQVATIFTNFGHSLNLSGSSLQLLDGVGTVLNSITLPPSGVTSITTGDGLAGGTITTTGIISHGLPEGATHGTKGNATDGALEFIKTITTDDFGHIIGYTTGSLTVYNGAIS